MSQSTATPAAAPALDAERAELLETLATHRRFLRHTVAGLTDEQASRRTTASELTLGGLIKHVTRTEGAWIDFVLQGPAAMQPPADGDYSDWTEGFRMVEGETLAGLLEEYERTAARTAEVVAGLADLSSGHPLPPAPWFEPGATRSARRVLLHLIAETAQHAGHADILRESLDGQKTMG